MTRQLKHADGCRPEEPCRFCKARVRTARFKTAHPGYAQEEARRRRTSDPERYKAYNRQYYQDNKDRLRTYYREWYETNKEGWKQRTLAYSKTDKARQRRSEKFKQRFQSDLEFRLGQLLRTRFQVALRRKGQTKLGVFERDLLGCTVAEFRSIIEALWRPGMTWENWGVKGWHIDHIRPLASFDLSDPEQQRRACHFTNLQPLWWHENLEKGDKMLDSQEAAPL